MMEEDLTMKKTTFSRQILVPTAIIFLWGATLFFVEGCARIPLSYLSGSINKISGSVSISNFKYVPAETGKVKTYQIRNTAVDSLKFDKNIDTFFRDAVVTELSSTGVKVNDKNRFLDGEIEDFLIDELSTSADWTLTVNYSVKNIQTGKILYESTKITKRNASKLVNISSAVNEMIKLNIEELLKDEEFIKAIN
jgi:hypothetical protein